MKLARRAVNGVLLLNKHAGISSSTAVGWSKRLFNADKAGHTGTLDPFATGLLPICFGEAAKFARFMLNAQKGYRATLKLGRTSSTGDTEGAITERGPVSVDAMMVKTVLEKFIGTQTQVPPMHSALKQDGVPLYKLARRGLEVARESRHVYIEQLALVSLEGDVLVIDALVSKGTYIRVLGEDIGAALGCGAYLTALTRTSTGGFDVSASLSLEQLDAMTLEARDATLRPADSLALALPALTLNSDQARALQCGQTPGISTRLADATECRAYAETGEFLGVAQITSSDGVNATLTALRLMTPRPTQIGERRR